MCDHCSGGRVVSGSLLARATQGLNRPRERTDGHKEYNRLSLLYSLILGNLVLSSLFTFKKYLVSGRRVVPDGNVVCIYKTLPCSAGTVSEMLYLPFTNQNSIKHFIVSIRRQAKKSISRFSYYVHQVLNAGFTRAWRDWRIWGNVNFRVLRSVLRHFIFDAILETHSGP